MSTILTLTATGLAGVVLGAGIGIATADAPDPHRDRPAATAPADMGSMDMGSMDEMHRAMRDLVPAEMAEQHDQMHAAMGDRMGDTMARPEGVSPEEHAEHHPDEQEG